MNRYHLYLLLLAVVLACGYVKAQSEDELPIPIESDNQFPPDIHSESDGTIIEGSGAGVGEAPALDITTEQNATPKLEEIESTTTIQSVANANTENDASCPKPCVCRIEGETNDFVVDCSGYGITEFPSPINPKATKLNLQKNKLTEIPKEVSLLKNLKELNANDNLIMGLASGSVSELPELVVLKLANNRLIEYPKDLKNSLSLTKLQELDLGGNDMRTLLSPEIFTGFSNLRKITLATSTTELVQDICARFKKTLETVCTESCSKQSFDCPDAPEDIDDDMLQVSHPRGRSSIKTAEDKENADPSINIPIPDNTNEVKITKVPETSSTSESTIKNDQTAAVMNNIAHRTIVQNAPADSAPSKTIESTPKEPTSADGDVKIGAKTSDSKSGGGVDRNIIAVIVAGMVVVIAVITIKKNWTSIKNRFSSTPRPNERSGGNANGTTPEEVPLQDKAPV